MSVAGKTKNAINFVLIVVTVSRVVGMLMSKDTRRAILSDAAHPPEIR